MVQRLFKDISCRHFIQQSGTIWAILVEGYEGHYCEIILNLDWGWFKKICCLKIFSTALAAIYFCSLECDHLGNFGRVHYYEGHFCEIILNLDLGWFKTICCLKIISTALVAILFAVVGPFGQFW